MFGDKEALMDALYDHALLWIRQYNDEHSQEGCNVFSSVGLAHMNIARKEPNLFDFVYLSPFCKAEDMDSLSRIAEQPGVIQKMAEAWGIDNELAHDLYLDMAIYAHGLASLVVTGAHIGNDEIRARMNTVFYALAEARGAQLERKTNF